MAVTKLETAYCENGTDNVAVFKLKKSNYQGGLASVLGITFGEPPTGKTPTYGSVGSHSREVRLLELKISYQFKPGVVRQASIYCAPGKADDAMKNQGEALRGTKYNGKQILRVRDNKSK